MNAAKLHETALHHAAKVKNADLVEMLIEFGGNIYARDNRGKKPSDYTWSSSPSAKCFEFYESKSPTAMQGIASPSANQAILTIPSAFKIRSMGPFFPWLITSLFTDFCTPE